MYSLLRCCPAEKEWAENKVELLITISGAVISNNSQPRDSEHTQAWLPIQILVSAANISERPLTTILLFA